jgi:hypothetical protein
VKLAEEGSMAAVTGLTVIKKFAYRGDATEEFSNQYWFTGAVPASTTAWRALFDALVAEEKKLYRSGVSIIRGYGYGSDVETAPAVYSVDLTQAPNTPVLGNYVSNPTFPLAPGDTAGWVRWKTDRLNTKGKPIYLRKYFHGVALQSTAGGDAIDATQVTAYSNFGAKLRDGSFLDARTLRSQHHDETLLGHGVSTYATTRTLKRRGKRPGS